MNLTTCLYENAKLSAIVTSQKSDLLHLEGIADIPSIWHFSINFACWEFNNLFQKPFRVKRINLKTRQRNPDVQKLIFKKIIFILEEILPFI